MTKREAKQEVNSEQSSHQQEYYTIVCMRMRSSRKVALSLDPAIRPDLPRNQKAEEES